MASALCSIIARVLGHGSILVAFYLPLSTDRERVMHHL